MREGAARARAARAPTLNQRMAALHRQRLRLIAVRWCHAAMQEGLEWAVQNPDSFLKSGGQTIGVLLTEEERKAATDVLEDLLARLKANSLPLWKCPGGRRAGTRNKKTIERELAEHGARRGW